MARRLALLIGNGVFDDKEAFPPLLPATTNDVEDMAKVLAEHGSFEIFDTLFDQNHTAINERIEDFYKSAEKGDLTLLYYSGHGYCENQEKLYLAAKNTNPKRMRSTSVNDSHIRELVDASNSKHRIIILDCCYGGALTLGQKSMKEPVNFEKLKGAATIILTSSSRSQKSIADLKERNSLFTKYFLEGITTGKATNNTERYIYPNDLFNYTYKCVTEERSNQTPNFINDIDDPQLYLTLNPAIDEITGLLPTELQTIIKSEVGLVRESAVRWLFNLKKDENIKLANAASEKLTEMLRDNDERVSSLAQELLQDSGQPAVLSAPTVVKPKPTITPIKETKPQTLNGVSKPMWATELAKDLNGVYADLNIKNASQRLRWIEPGEFMMGSPETEKDRFDNEVQHRVRLTEGFWLADTACSQAFYKAVIGDNPSHFKGDDLPVEKVSWKDVQIFTKKLNDLTKTNLLRLPTEAEWEYACRAGSEIAFAYGNEIQSNLTNYNQNNKQTVPVKSLYQNDWGLYQMHGNVWEWCSDWYGKYDTTEGVTPAKAGDIVSNPQGPNRGDGRVLRGGSWIDYARYCRSALRRGFQPDYRYYSFGFRLSSGHPVTE